ncbi:DegT/DnrJ/EryC1/StrS family aminotransferase [Cohnella soli]|uniref:DegT/DnrJ/EryC1/StrS family aminotransferase n=1 Tax=Cohnella soli TaxID=425005 RepID=A0ABW0HQM8_9BACL
MRLAIDGGKPARNAPLPPNYPGAVMMGQEEAAGATEVILSKSPFRYYGPDVQNAVHRFEDTMSAGLGVPYALGVSSCTSALIVALKALGIGYGDKVIVPANTFLATAGAVVCSHAVPVFVDVDDSLNMNPLDLERVWDEDVKAIIAVPILGNPCDMDAIMAFARARGVPVIEDVAQSCGSSYKGRYAGTIGDIGVFSFQMNKIITSGEGGAVVTRDALLFERAVRYHDQGLFRDKERYGLESDEEANGFIGQNYRMSELAGSVLIEQWNKLEGINASTRRNHAAILSVLKASLPGFRSRKVVDEEGYLGSNLGMILPSAETAAAFIRALDAENIGTHLLYGGKPVYRQPQLYEQRTADKNNFPFDYRFRKPVSYKKQPCQAAEDLMARTVYLPVSPLLTSEDIEQITEGIVKVHRALVSEARQ